MCALTIGILLVTSASQVVRRQVLALADPDNTPWPATSPYSSNADPVNLLVNGNMDELSFYWEYPNHYVAGGWNRWWIDGTVLPEYDDTRTARPHYDGAHAQVYFKWYGWNQAYIAGIYQVVENVTPCQPYRLTMMARNHTLDDVLPRARIGLDPIGTQLTSGPSSGAVAGLPGATVWSAEQTNLFVWEELATTAEPVGNKITAILYAAPKVPPDTSRAFYTDTFWDGGKLVASEFPNGLLPAPQQWNNNNFISNLTYRTEGTSLVVEWDTTTPASTQVWYRFITDTSPISPSITTYTYTVYFPLISKSIRPLLPTDLHTTLDTTPVTHHQAGIPNLQNGDRISFGVLSRRPSGTTCVTEGTYPNKIIDIALP